jgi:hypothetical protein
MNNLSSNVDGDLMKKFGLDKDAASSIVAMLLPIVMSKLVKKQMILMTPASVSTV